MKKLMVLCTGNSCRSQIAHGYFEKFSGNNIEVYSAGVETHGVNPRALLVMNEDGVDISNNTSNNILEYNDITFDFIITVCDSAKERCPYFPSKSLHIHHSFSDPASATGTEDQILDSFREVRDEIKTFVRGFIKQYLSDIA
ncbi:MAG: arsenate reductase ArsC [Saprospiraceae bacterium]|nr:arsenate reductase ArsC [Saprospiraceae bacterium]